MPKLSEFILIAMDDGGKRKYAIVEEGTAKMIPLIKTDRIHNKLLAELWPAIYWTEYQVKYTQQKVEGVIPIKFESEENITAGDIGNKVNEIIDFLYFLRDKEKE